MSIPKGDVSYKNLFNPAFALLADFFESFKAPDLLLSSNNQSGVPKYRTGSIKGRSRIKGAL